MSTSEWTRPQGSPPDRREPTRAEAIVEASLDCIVTIDASGRVLEFNPAAERTFGWSRDEAVGRRMEELFIPPEYHDAHAQGIERYLATGEGPVLNTRLELPAVRRDGTPIIVELIAVPIRNKGCVEFIGFMRDITELRRTQEALAHSEQRYRTVVGHSREVIAVLRPGDDGWQASILTGAEQVAAGDLSADDEFNPLDLVHPDDQEEVLRALLATMGDPLADAEQVEVRAAGPHGGWRTFEAHLQNLTDVSEVGGLLVRASDVTEERARQEELHDAMTRMRTLISSLHAGVLLEDETRRLLLVNEVFLRQFGLPGFPADLIGMDCTASAEAVKHLFADPDAFVRTIERRLADQVPATDERLAMVDGTVLERDFVPVRTPERYLGHLWVYRDVTERIREEEALEERSRSLAELAALKNEFVATVSHELRTPLTSVVSFAELLADPDGDDLSGEQQQYLEVILRNGQRLLRLIDDLLLVAKMESRTLPLVPGQLDLGVLVGEVLDDLGPQAEAKELTVRRDLARGPTYVGDHVRLQQLVTNLVSNAVRYTPAGGQVTVSLRRDDEAAWVLDVSDTGIGIPAAEAAGLFDAFFRASNSGARSGGTGLGLAISRLIVDLHGGSIRADSTEGVGTVVTVRLPDAQLPRPEQAGAA